MTKKPTQETTLSKAARAALLRRRFRALAGPYRWKADPTKKPKPPLGGPIPKHQTRSSALIALRQPRVPLWAIKEAARKQVEDELARLKESNVPNPLTKIMWIFEEARVECRDLRELAVGLKTGNHR